MMLPKPPKRTVLGLFELGLSLIASSAITVEAHKYPNPFLYELESQLYDREGYRSRSLFTGMIPDCSSFFFGGGTGRSNAADWIRTAYHDMATHNVTDGSGGLDASIRFEQDRAENAGDGFDNTFAFITGNSNRYFSLADNLAMAAVTAIEACGGPKIAYRGGRMDAAKAGRPGVPEPQQNLTEHIANFARQGFTKEEMIGFIACGHTFGGVQHVAFPDIVPASTEPNNTSGNSPFDTTFTHFDNRIATEYLSSTTTNPLVVGHNVTTRSDFRIFNSDNNVTMSKFADPDVFRMTCAKLFARMIDTVPKGVKLTEIIEPIKVKPVNVGLLWVGAGKISLQGEVRMWNMTPRELTLRWKARDGSNSSRFSVPLVLNTSHVTNPHVPGSPDLRSKWFDLLPVFLNSTQSISKFWFEMKLNNGSTVVEDLNGSGYHLQDAVMLANSSCVRFGEGSSSTVTLNLTFAIRGDIKPRRVYLKADDFDDVQRPNITTIDIVSPTNATTRSVAGYTVWNSAFGFSGRPFTLAINAGNTTYETIYDPSGVVFGGGPFGISVCRDHVV
ncbi:heme peroxidase [Cristinia sonorae]|uniref:Peroxidase n=1 Tax=Cristinia sonorae TaxID=1940300 RepID=A0A8K0XQU1_9AGAR|nr:heme peroxidase [Cristinia sonorae]